MDVYIILSQPKPNPKNSTEIVGQGVSFLSCRGRGDTSFLTYLAPQNLT